jgi:hypothetical protein
VQPDDFTRLGDRWNRRARDAFFLIPTVPQPLWDVLGERAEIEAALVDPNRVRPIHGHYHARRVSPVLAGI